MTDQLRREAQHARAELEKALALLGRCEANLLTDHIASTKGAAQVSGERTDALYAVRAFLKSTTLYPLAEAENVKL